jgi:hypothetical protein
VQLPSLIHDFGHARIESVMLGPRRELNLIVTPLVWKGHTGQYSQGVGVRFGGVANLDEVRAFFSDAPQERSELAKVGYAADRRSKPGRLFFELVFERIDGRLIVECSNIQVSG